MRVAVFLSASGDPQTKERQQDHRRYADAFEEHGPGGAAGVDARLCSRRSMAVRMRPGGSGAGGGVSSWLALGIYQISLGDTTRRGDPLMVEGSVRRTARAVSAGKAGAALHDTRAPRSANILARVALGIITVDSALGAWATVPMHPMPAATSPPNAGLHAGDGRADRDQPGGAVDTSRQVAARVGTRTAVRHLVAR